MNDLQTHVFKKRIVDPARREYGDSSAEAKSAKRVAERTLRVISSGPPSSLFDLPPDVAKDLEPVARYYLERDGEAAEFYEKLYPANYPLPPWFVISKCMFRR